MQNIAMLYLTNSSSETLIFNPKEALGILDLDLYRLLKDSIGSIAVELMQILRI